MPYPKKFSREELAKMKKSGPKREAKKRTATKAATLRKAKKK